MDDDGYVLVIEGKEVVAESGLVMSAAGQRYYVHMGGEDWPWDTGVAYDPTRPFRKRVKIFASCDDARAYAGQWKGHPWWVKPSGRYEIVRVAGVYEKVLVGYEAVGSREEGNGMEWMKDSPTTVGFYWLVGRYEGIDEPPMVVEVVDLLGELYVLWPGDERDVPVDGLSDDAKWAGPLVCPPFP